MHFKGMAGKETVQSLKPAQDGLARATLTAERMGAGKAVVHIFREGGEQRAPLASIEQTEHANRATADDRVIHQGDPALMPRSVQAAPAAAKLDGEPLATRRALVTSCVVRDIVCIAADSP